jgi:DHA1 family multidrug resistance protein-like MFS transporter
MSGLRASLYDVIRDAPFGQLMRYVTRDRLFRYPEEEPDFHLHDPWIRLANDAKSGIETPATQSPTAALHSPPSSVHDSEGLQTTELADEKQEDQSLNRATESPDIENTKTGEKDEPIPIVPTRTKDGSILVDWYNTDDPANPHNWSNRRRGFLALLICTYTFVVYTTSAIYTASEPGVMEKFHVSSLKASLGLSIYVLGYGVGPLIFSPLSEIPRIGRSPVYIVTMLLFVVISIPTALVNNFPGLIVLRFLQGFFGSPCLASGGASMGDMYSLMALPFAMIAWVSAAYCGRTLDLFQWSKLH